MATFHKTEELSLCSICVGQYTNRNLRLLPVCRHTFCENCLMTYIDNLISNDKDITEVPCPNCRKQVSLPENTKENLQNWIKSLDNIKTNDEMAVNRGLETETGADLCISCLSVDKAEAAEKFCIECQENLCSNCSRIRHGTKLISDHTLVELGHTQEVRDCEGKHRPLQRLMDCVKCPRHPVKTISVICRDDDSLCCPDCVMATHRHCENIESLNSERILSETEMKLREVKEQMKKVVSQIKLLEAYKNYNLANIKRKSEGIVDKVKDIRQRINTFLDNMEERINSDAKAFVKTCTIETDSELSKLSDISQMLEEQLSLVEYTEKLKSYSKMFTVANKVMTEIQKIEKNIMKTAREFYKNTYEIELKVKPILDAIVSLDVNDTDQAALIEKTEMKVPISGFEEKQIKFAGALEKIAEHAILPPESSCSYPHYYGVVYRKKPNDLFLISYECHHFCCSADADKNYNKIKYFGTNVFGGRPFNATSLRDGEMAVSVPEQTKIFFLTENNISNQLQASVGITTKYSPKALFGMKNGDLAVSWNGPVAFGILQFKCNLYEPRFQEVVYFSNDTSGRKLKTFDFMAIDETRSHVIQPCTADKAVYCFDYGGTPQFKYTHEDLVLPRGVAIDGDGNIFVCDETKSVIHVVSPEGEGLYILKDGCPTKPLAIAFDQSGFQFVVSQNCDPWKILKIFRLA